MSDDTVDTAVEPVFSEEQQVYMDKMLEKQTETLTAKLTSHFGRISKEQVNKSVKEKLDPEKINESLSNRLFGGDVNGAVRDIIKNVREEESQLATQKKQMVLSEMEKFEDKPLYKETKDEILKLANDAINNGFPPAPAVELAYEKAGKYFLQNKDPDYKLQMSGSGKTPVRTKKTKLPSEFKAAAARDIADGLYKDEAEYLEQLSPAIREKYNI